VIKLIPKYLAASLSLISKFNSPPILNFLKNVSINPTSIFVCYFNKLIKILFLFFDIYYYIYFIFKYFKLDGWRLYYTCNIITLNTTYLRIYNKYFKNNFTKIILKKFYQNNY
jgi:hypothetical protein